MVRGLKLFPVLLILVFFSTVKAYAASNFSTDYNVTYTVNNRADTHVNLSVVLTNLTDKYYASSYSIQVGFTDIKNLTAYDSGGTVTPDLTTGAKGSDITINFTSPIVGINKKMNYDISFDTSQIAENLNNTWNINIPGIASQNDFSSFNVYVNYPQSLGNPTYIKPDIQNAVLKTGQLFFNKGDLGGAGISIAFGNFQVYNFNLSYHLQNTNVYPISTEIALPPDTNYQDVAIDNMVPKPENVTVDSDGNWLAEYVLSPSKTIDVEVNGKVKVYLYPKEETLSTSLMQDYLKPEKYWESDNPEIISLANNLKTPYAIYEYVVKTLNYDFSRVESNSPRLGAVGALNNKNSAVCLEFTDLFIALARAAGIPAREIDGYAYTTNTNERPLSLVEDILHAWPEYYDFDRKEWIMVDPTWANTTGGIDYFNTLDFNHIAFVVKGENSQYPIPAGGYKLVSEKNTKDVNVKIGSSFSYGPTNVRLSTQIPNSVLAGLTVQGLVKIENVGYIEERAGRLSVTANYLNPTQQSAMTNPIPPFGYEAIPVSFNRTPVLTNTTDEIKIAFGNRVIYKNMQILPFFVSKLFLMGVIAIVSIIVLLSLAAYLFRRIYLFRQKG